MPIRLVEFASPILERLLDERGERHDQPAQVPQADHHIRRGDLLDAAGFVFDHDLVVDPDRLRGRDLDAGDKVGQQRACGQSHHQSGDARRGEQAHAVLAHGIEGHQHRAERHHHDQGVERALENAHLGDVLACQQIVGGLDGKAMEVDAGAGLDRDMGDPAGQYDEGYQQEPPDRCADGLGERRRLQRRRERERHQRQGERPLALPEERTQERMALTEGAAEHEEDDAMDRQRADHGNEQYRDPGEPWWRPVQRLADGRKHRLHHRPNLDRSNRGAPPRHAAETVRIGARARHATGPAAWTSCIDGGMNAPPSRIPLASR